jgi:hypothetical protein
MFIRNPMMCVKDRKYIWAVLIKLHDSATYDDRRNSYGWLKWQYHYLRGPHHHLIEN